MIEVIERSIIETKGFNLDFGNNEELKKAYEAEGYELPEKTDKEVDKNVDDLTKYPIVWIDGVMVEGENVSELKLFNNGFMPKLNVKFTDPTNNLIDKNFPSDNTIVSIFKQSKVKDLMGIKMDFKITDLKIIKGISDKATLTYELEAIMNIDDFYLMNFEAFEGTSYNVIKDLMKEMGLGFASNISNSNDDMVWVNPANYRIEFIRDIISKTYIDDDTFLFGYIDFYYNFNYVDIETQMKEDISNQMNLASINESNKDSQDKEVPLILTNSPDRTTSNLHIQKYTLINSSTSTNLAYGYRHYVNYYNKSDDELKKYALDNITSDDDNTIVLKGNDVEPNTLYDELYNDTWMGKLDIDNVHENYLHSSLQNQNNLKFLQKLKMTVKMAKVNYGLYRFQKVLVELYNMGKMDDPEKTNFTDEEIERGAQQNDTKIINKLSGEWVITAINLTFSKKDGIIQELTLVKRELTEEYTFPRREQDDTGQEKKKNKDNSKQKETKNPANADNKEPGAPPSIQDALDLPPGTYNYTNK